MWLLLIFSANTFTFFFRNVSHILTFSRSYDVANLPCDIQQYVSTYR